MLTQPLSKTTTKALFLSLVEPALALGKFGRRRCY